MTVKDRQLYQQILVTQKPWKVASVNVPIANDEAEAVEELPA